MRGGTGEGGKVCGGGYITGADVLVGAGIAPDMGHSTWTVTSPSGTTVTRTLTPYRPSGDEPDMNRTYSNEPLKDLGADWVAYQPDRALPITFSDFDKTFRRVLFPHSCSILT